MRADLILKLIKANRSGDSVLIRKTVEAMAAEERAKNHTILANRMLALLNDGNGSRGHTMPLLNRSVAGALVAERVPERRLEDLVLPSEVRETMQELVTEQHRCDLLRSYSLEPRNRVLLAGPPGNGKTTLAEALAYALSVPLLSVRYEAVIGSYLGETAQRISQVFEYASSRQCVLFFDEFDALGKERGDPHETGEIKRVVSSLLLRIDALPSYVVVVTATNHPELLDRAVWRRFQIRLELPLPTQSQIEAWFKRFEERHGYHLGFSPQSLAQRLCGLSYAEIENFSTDILRKVVLSQPDQDCKAIVSAQLRYWKKRYVPTSLNKNEQTV